MEVFNYTFEKTTKAKIFLMGDIHEGNINHDEISFKKAINHIKNEKDPYIVIFMGDMTDCINTKDPRFSASEIERKYSIRDLKDLPRKQMKCLYQKVKPIEDKIKFSLIGNHEETYIKHHGFDVYDYFCTDLLPNCQKLGYQAIGNIRINDGSSKKIIKIALTHGSGGGGYREGYPLNNCVDIFNKFDCDINVMAHVHKLLSKCYHYVTISKSNKMITKKKFYGISGCFLKTFVVGTRNYFEGQKGTLSEIGLLEISVQKKEKGWEYDMKPYEF
jgi:predicted phosphodiesterase